MINIIGNICIFSSIASSLAGIFFAGRRSSFFRNFTYFNFAAMTVACLAMVYALLTNDFSVSYVAHVGAKETPRFFAAISLWSSLEGSILLWGWVLSGYTAASLWRYRNDFENLMPWVAITLLAIGVFFYLVLAIPANPFHTVFPVPDNGPGPNPLLQNHWLMAFHPPALYMGYVGMSVPFAFAVASMVTGDLSSTWVDVTRRWTLFAWAFLSVAIILGGWWSYAVLGWGGYWAWDPVENASFMPWLVATAFIHSVMVQQRQGMLKVWNLILIVATFLLTLLGTFLTRSGVLDSVHSFTESGIGHYFLAAIATTLAVSVALLIWKAPQFKSPGRLDSAFSRGSFFLFNNLLLTTFCSVVLLGTLYPLVVEALKGVKVTVGEPFFNQMTVPLALLLILLMGIGVAMPWRKADRETLKKVFLPPLALAAATTLTAFLLGITKGWVLATLLLGGLSLAVMLIEMGKNTLKQRSLFKIFALHPRRYGAFLVHIGVIIIALGIAFSGSYQQERQVSMKRGERLEIGKYGVELDSLFARQKPQRFEIVAQTKISQGKKVLGFLSPSLNYYPTSREPIGSPAIRSTPMDDLYLTLMAFDPANRQATLRVMNTPAVSWIWSGAVFIVFGVVVAGWRKKEPAT